MESAYLKIPWKFGDNTPKLSITKVFSLKAFPSSPTIFSARPVTDPLRSCC